MVGKRECENRYLDNIFNSLKPELPEDVHFIVARTNTPQEIEQFKA
jgi:hypothetical protein